MSEHGLELLIAVTLKLISGCDVTLYDSLIITIYLNWTHKRILSQFKINCINSCCNNCFLTEDLSCHLLHYVNCSLNKQTKIWGHWWEWCSISVYFVPCEAKLPQLKTPKVIFKAELSNVCTLTLHRIFLKSHCSQRSSWPLQLENLLSNFVATHLLHLSSQYSLLDALCHIVSHYLCLSPTE